MKALAQWVVILAGCYLIGLALVAWLAPMKARRFLMSHAATLHAHGLEMAVRLIAGAAFVLRAPFMPFAEAFRLLGWTLVVTTVCLVLMPWAWHQRFAQKVIPPLLDRLEWLAVPSLAAGCFILGCAVSSAGFRW